MGRIGHAKSSVEEVSTNHVVGQLDQSFVVRRLAHCRMGRAKETGPDLVSGNAETAKLRVVVCIEYLAQERSINPDATSITHGK